MERKGNGTKSNPVLAEFKAGDKRDTASILGDRTIRKAEDKILSGKLYQSIPERKGHRTVGEMWIPTNSEGELYQFL